MTFVDERETPVYNLHARVFDQNFETLKTRRFSLRDTEQNTFGSHCTYTVQYGARID